jgi:cytochrome c oxidase assembly protein subunit 11
VQDIRHEVRERHQRVVMRLTMVLLCSALFAFALVPLYDVLCRITGLNGRTSEGFGPGGLFAVSSISGVDRSRIVTVEFTGTVMPGLQWEMHPLVASLSLHPGEPGTVSYLVRNLGLSRVEGQAIPGVTPGQASRYFHKVECFCFSHQPMNPGEVREMPVTFIIRPDLDPEVSQITLSYAFFPVARVRQTASELWRKPWRPVFVTGGRSGSRPERQS